MKSYDTYKDIKNKIYPLEVLRWIILKMNFNGDRLRIARIYRNMTISDLGKKISVTKQAISQYEKGIIAPKSEVLKN